MKILIVGLARTGTTALQHLIAGSLTGKVKLIAEPRICPPEVETFAGDLVVEVIIKPDVNWHLFAGFDKRIIMMRDPRDRLISNLLHSLLNANSLHNKEQARLVRECLARKERAPASVSIRAILEAIGKASKNPSMIVGFNKMFAGDLMLFDYFVANDRNAFLYRYEDFEKENFAPLQAYLGRPLLVKSVVPPDLGGESCPNYTGAWRNWFTTEDVKEYQPVIGPWLERFGYDASDWRLNAEPVIDSKYCSEYFMLLVKESLASKETKQPPPNENDGAGSPEKLHSAIAKGALDQINEYFCKGWAVCINNPTEVAKVRIFINDRLMHTAEADLPRPDVKRLGIHPTGLCGFRFEWPVGMKPQAGDRVETWVEGDVKQLNGSPKFMTALLTNTTLPNDTVGKALTVAEVIPAGADMEKSPVLQPAATSGITRKSKIDNNFQNGSVNLAASINMDIGKGRSLKKHAPVARIRVEVAELVKKVSLDLPGLPEKEAMVLLQEALTLLGKRIASLDEGVVKVHGFGRFRISSIKFAKHGKEVKNRQVIFNLLKPSDINNK